MEGQLQVWGGLVSLMLRRKIQAALNPFFQETGKDSRTLESALRLSATDCQGFKLDLLAMAKVAVIELIDEQIARVETDPARSAKHRDFSSWEKSE